MGRNSHQLVTVSSVTANGTLQSSRSANAVPATTASAAPTAKCAWRQTTRITISHARKKNPATETDSLARPRPPRSTLPISTGPSSDAIAAAWVDSRARWQ